MEYCPAIIADDTKLKNFGWGKDQNNHLNHFGAYSPLFHTIIPRWEE